LERFSVGKEGETNEIPISKRKTTRRSFKPRKFFDEHRHETRQEVKRISKKHHKNKTTDRNGKDSPQETEGTNKQNNR